MRHCIRCDGWKDETEFNVRDSKRELLQYVCRDCQKEQGRERYANNTDKVKGINNNARINSKKNAIDFIKSFLNKNHCVDCGETDIAVLTFDHVRGKKKYNVSAMIQGAYGINAIKQEVEKTEVVCFNCHMRREQKRRGSWRLGWAIELERLVAKEINRGQRPSIIDWATRYSISATLEVAYKWGLVLRNVADLAQAPVAEKKIPIILNVTEINKLLEFVKGDRWYAFYACAASLGIREGEILALEWKDIDFKNKTVSINKQTQYLPGKGISVKYPKTKSWVCQEGCVNGVNHHDCNLPAAAQQRADCAQLGSLPSNRIAS